MWDFAVDHGLTFYRTPSEIDRAVAEGKLVQLRVRGRVQVTEQDARAAYQHWLKEIGDQQTVDARLLALRILPGISPTAFPR